MKQRVITILAAVGLVALLGAAASTFVTQNLVVQQTSNLAVATASSLGLTGASTAPLITQCNASPPTGGTSTGSMCLDPTNASPWVYNGTSWVAVGGGGMKAWAAGTSTANTLVYDGACSYTFVATASTSTEPCWDLGDGTNLLWQRNNVSTATNGKVVLINGAAGTVANMISKTTWSGWTDRELIVDVSIQGTADAMGFGVFDGSLSSTQTGAMVNPGSYGVELDIFNNQVQSITNGAITAGSQIPVRSGLIKNDGSLIFDRYYLDFHNLNNGSTQLTLYRNHQNTTPNDSAYGPCDQCFGPSSAFRKEFWATWQIATPSFTTWKFIVAARTGGSGGTFQVNKIQSRDVPGTGAWKSVSTLPDL